METDIWTHLWFQLNDPSLPLWNHRFAERYRAYMSNPAWLAYELELVHERLPV